jgi:hypothetical protein
MQQIFSWGYEAYAKEDYTKNNADISNKIRKSKREYITENHDNFRAPEKSADSNTLLFNYFEKEEADILKKRLMKLKDDELRTGKKQSAYKEHHCDDQYNAAIDLLNQVTSAGKERYGPKLDKPITPEMLNVKGKAIEALLVNFGIDKSTFANDIHDFYKEHEHLTNSPTRNKFLM